MKTEIRSMTNAEIDTWLTTMARAEGRHLSKDSLVYGKNLIESDRALSIYDSGQIVGTIHTELSTINVPGNILQTAILAYVTTQPTHRRRGMLTKLITYQLSSLYEEGIPLSNLFASESLIYGRFGYGIATQREDWTIERPHTGFIDNRSYNGQVEFVDSEHMRTEFPSIYDEAVKGRPGIVHRPNKHWDLLAMDPEERRKGYGKFFFVEYKSQNVPKGYVMYRIKGNNLRVRELMSTDHESYSALWQYCFGVDLIATFEAKDRVGDDSLPWLLIDPRKLRRSVQDGMWLRIIDTTQVLENRSYNCDGNLTLRILDKLCPWNEKTLKLTSDNGGTICKESNESPDLTLTAGTLGSAYLGGVGFTNLGKMGLVEEHTFGKLKVAEDMFYNSLAPWSPDTFEG